MAKDASYTKSFILYILTDAISGNKPRFKYDILNRNYLWIICLFLVYYRRLKLTTVAILAVIALYHSLSNKWSNRINQALVTTKVLTVLTVVVLGLSFAKASAERVYSKNVNWDMFSPASPDFYQNVSATEWIQRYITAMLTILFAYAGWNNLNCKH